MDCIFCKIAAGEIPAIKVLDEERVIAFMDINPATPGHLLVIPKRHAENIFEIPESDLAALMKGVKKCARAVRDALNAGGVTILQLNGKASDQIVSHIHVHVLPRQENDGLSVTAWELKPGDMKEIQAIADKVKERV